MGLARENCGNARYSEGAVIARVIAKIGFVGSRMPALSSREGSNLHASIFRGWTYQIVAIRASARPINESMLGA